MLSVERKILQKKRKNSEICALMPRLPRDGVQHIQRLSQSALSAINVDE
ncbi:hypothetical protein VIB_001781 [Vibrio metschnikovii CIP 69.14]|nr:hypothetical protein VIB_001781 [Vibrio metschnikovii CIP 69.14]